MNKNIQRHVKIVASFLIYFTIKADAQNGIVHSSSTNKNIVNMLKFNPPSGFSAEDSNAHVSTDAFLSTGIVTPPSAPTITNVTTGKCSLSISFKAPANNGGSTITNYKYSLNGGITYYSAATTNSPISLKGLNKGIAYTVMLKAVNSVGDGTAVLVCLARW